MTYMKSKISGKINKSYYMPAWIVDMVNEEGDRYDGPGVLVSTAIKAFYDSTDQQKRQMYKAFRQSEIDYAYAEPQSDAKSVVKRVVAREATRKQKKVKPQRSRA